MAMTVLGVRAGMVPAMRWGTIRCGRAGSTCLLRWQPERPRLARQYHPWVQPALLAAGGITLTVIAWPVMRYVVLGTLGYGAYRVVRALLVLRSLSRLSSGAGLWEQMVAGLGMSPVAPAVIEVVQRSAQAALRASCASPDIARVLTSDADSVELGDPVDTRSALASGERPRIEIVFPVLMAGQGVPVFVQAVATTGTGNVDYIATIEELRVLVRQSSGSVLSIPIKHTPAGAKARSAHNVRDADYRDL
ncbi:hypothetical protein H4R19_000636 [Coemansia spiralis]|nr:hypothetical protein H4R19_000636 [Coemansia spiralis]